MSKCFSCARRQEWPQGTRGVVDALGVLDYVNALGVPDTLVAVDVQGNVNYVGVLDALVALDARHASKKTNKHIHISIRRKP